MQELIQDGIRLVGFVLLWAISLGRYRSAPDALLLEGVIGLVSVIGVGYLVYSLAL